MSDPLYHLGSIWYHLENVEVPYSVNQFLGWDFFCRFLEETGSKAHISDHFQVYMEVIMLITQFFFGYEKLLIKSNLVMISSN